MLNFDTSEKITAIEWVALHKDLAKKQFISFLVVFLLGMFSNFSGITFQIAASMFIVAFGTFIQFKCLEDIYIIKKNPWIGDNNSKIMINISVFMFFLFNLWFVFHFELSVINIICSLIFLLSFLIYPLILYLRFPTLIEEK